MQLIKTEIVNHYPESLFCEPSFSENYFSSSLMTVLASFNFNFGILCGAKSTSPDQLSC